MSQPFVTVFILIYNNVQGLEKTVASVLSQSYRNAEIILSDDGSSNYDTELLKHYAGKLREKYAQVRINVNPQNIGTVKHLNRVFAMAKGEYLISCSSGDSFYEEKTVGKIVQAFEKKRTLILSTRRADVYPEGKTKIRPWKFTGWEMRFFPKRFLRKMICEKNVLSGCCTFYKKELFEKHGFFDESYHLVEDYPYYVELLRKGETIAFSPMITVSHGIGGVSTGKIHPSIYKDIELLREKLYGCRKEFDPRTKKFLEECHQKK